MNASPGIVARFRRAAPDSALFDLFFRLHPVFVVGSEKREEEMRLHQIRVIGGERIHRRADFLDVVLFEGDLRH